MAYTYRGKLAGDKDPWQQPRHLKAVPEPKPAPVPKPAPKPKRELAPCGTNAAYVRHHKHGEAPCAACTEARREYVAETRKSPTRRRPVAQCGTYSGAIKHRRNKETPCEPCKQAAREYRNTRRAELRKAA